MGKYSKYRRKSEQRPGTHPIWRGIGCILIVVVPLISYALTVIFIPTILATGLVPYQLVGHVQFPDWVYRAPVLGNLAIFIGGIDNLWLKLIGFFVILLVSLSRMQQLSNYIDRVMSRETGRLSRLGRLWQIIARRTNTFVKEMLKAKETALHANRGHMTRGLVYSFISWGLVVVTPITLLYGLGVTSSVTQIIVATMIYYIAISYFPTPGASVGAELGAVALFAAFVPAGILGAFILVWRFFDHYIKMGAGGLMTFAEFVFKPARRRRRAVRQSKAGETKEKDGEP